MRSMSTTMSHWNWKCECCLILVGLLVGGPLGTIFLKTLQESVQQSFTHKSHNSYQHHRFLANSGGDSDGMLSSSTLSLLVPSSLWFLVTTSCVGCFFWGIGELLRKIHSSSKPPAAAGNNSRREAAASSSAQRMRMRRRSMDAAAADVGINGRVQFEGNGRLIVGEEEGGVALEGQIRGEIEQARLEGVWRGLGGLELVHNHQIHHFPWEGLIFPILPHGRLRLWGISFL